MDVMRSYCILYGDKDEINDVTSYAGRRAREALAKANEIMGEKHLEELKNAR